MKTLDHAKVGIAHRHIHVGHGGHGVADQRLLQRGDKAERGHRVFVGQLTGRVGLRGDQSRLEAVQDLGDRERGGGPGPAAVLGLGDRLSYGLLEEGQNALHHLTPPGLTGAHVEGKVSDGPLRAQHLGHAQVEPQSVRRGRRGAHRRSRDGQGSRRVGEEGMMNAEYERVRENVWMNVKRGRTRRGIGDTIHRYMRASG
jgi:hypothetical protein